MRGNRGFALVLTLVVTALMVAVTAELIHQVYVDTSLSRGFRDSQQASLVAESGITAGKQYIQFVFSGAYSWPLKPIEQSDETGSITITITEESGKICLNDLVPGNNTDFTMNALKRLGGTNVKNEFWDALTDWMDSDDNPSPGGAEKSYYLSLKPPYLPRNNKLSTFSELSLVKGFTEENGFTPDVVRKLAQCVSVYQTSGQRSMININTASQEVIAALDAKISADAGQVVKEVEAGRPFKSLNDLAQRIPSFGALTTGWIGYVTVQGDVFRITSKATVKDSARTVVAIWRKSNNTILSWQEY